jgi:lipoprotein NlpI
MSLVTDALDFGIGRSRRCKECNMQALLASALASMAVIIRLDPKYAQAYFNRGVANLYAGSLPKALADLGQSSELNPKYAYAALWLHIVDTRNNLPSQLAEAASRST